jgi:hypothetical protein
MKTTYETFDELAEAMCKGEGTLHAINCPEDRHPGSCIPWQQGVRAFAQWLDHIGCKVEVTDGPDGFYSFVSSHDLWPRGFG